MARSGITPTSEQSATVRQLKLLVVVLVFSNLGLGFFSFRLLREIDRSYSELIDRSVPVMSDLQTLTVKAMAAMRSTNPANRALADRGKSAPDGKNAITEDRVFRGKLISRGSMILEEKMRVELRSAGDAFSRLALQAHELLSAGKTAEVLRLRDEQLFPAFERYVTALTNAADGLELASLQENELMSKTTTSTSKVVLGIASWPILLLLGILLITVIFVLVLMVLFRGREMSEMP